MYDRGMKKQVTVVVEADRIAISNAYGNNFDQSVAAIIAISFRDGNKYSDVDAAGNYAVFWTQHLVPLLRELIDEEKAKTT